MPKVDLKVVMLGQSAVGKTSLVDRYVNERFIDRVDYRSTIGSAFSAKQIEIDDKKIVLGLWDTAGSERYRGMVSVYYRGAKAAIICFDICDKQSYIRAKSWVRELKSQEEGCIIYLCATKCDMILNGRQPSVSLEDIELYSKGIQSKFFMTSSKTGENVTELFEEIARDYVPDPKNSTNPDIVNLTIEMKKKPNCCASLNNRN